MSPNISVKCKDFTGSYFSWNGVHSYSISDLDVTRAISTLGLQSNASYKNPPTSDQEYRTGIGNIALAFLDFKQNELCLNQHHSNLDPTEKTFLSYWYGMTFAKIIAELHMSVPWLQHVDDLRKNGIIKLKTKSKKRGDLVGKDGNKFWHAIEAKCRSSDSFDLAGLKKSAKKQVQNIKSINRRKPATHSSAISQLSRSEILIHLDDPESYIEDGEDLLFDERDFFFSYYFGLIQYLSDSQDAKSYVDKFSGLKFKIAPLRMPGFFSSLYENCIENYHIGLHEEIYSHPENAYFYYERRFSKLHKESKNIGSDGIAIFKIQDI